MKRAFSLGLLGLPLLVAGCEQTRPPTPEGRRQIAARTATGTQTTKLEVKSQPDPPRAGQVAIWELKVFALKDTPEGLRKEWKFFATLGAQALAPGTSSTQDLMQIEVRDAQNRLIVQNRPTYKAYGSFLTDFKIPQPGKYTLLVRYQPSDRGKIFPLETARKAIEVVN